MTRVRSTLPHVAAGLTVVTLGVPPAMAWQDTTAVDTAATVQLPVDSVPATRFTHPMTEAEAPSGPLAPGTRYRFTRTSMIWTSSLTLADLLTTIPGVFVARGGFFGQPEYLMYGGRGAASIELFWDGLPMYPVGPDSVYLDPGRFGLSYLRQVDVVVLPGALRVYLVSERHERSEPRSVIRVTSGAFSTAQYAGLFQRRWGSGLGLNLAGDFMASDGDATSSREDQYFDLWAKLEWLPADGSAGAVYQVRRQKQDRDVRTGEGGFAVPERTGNRTEFLFKVFSGSRPDRLGFLAEAGLGSTAWTGDSLNGDKAIRQAFATLRYATPQLSLEATGRAADTRMRNELEGRVGWVPLPGVVLSGEGRWQRLYGGRSVRNATASMGLYAGPFSAVGQVTKGDVIQAPAVLADSGQQVSDASATLGLATKPLSGHVGLVKRAAFLPAPLPDYPGFPGMDSSVAATYLVADLTFRPVHPLFLTAWYSHPRTTPGDFQPPQHGRVDITFRSKFWRTFRSGAFEFLLRYGVEYWSSGTAGINTLGAPEVLPGATFHEWFVAFELVGFKAFWNLRNARNSLAQYVPTLPYPRNAQTFGVRWEFTN